MSQIVKVQGKQALKNLLKIIAEESVKRAKESENSELSSDSADAERLKQSQLNSDIKQFKEAQPPDETKTKLDEEAPEGQPVQRSQQAAPQQAAPQQDQGAVPDAPPKPKITFAMFRDKLNMIRSGRSLRDREIRAQLKDYFKNLGHDEKEALYVFLDAIVQIITAGISSEDAPEPDEPPHDIEMDKGPDAEPHEEHPGSTHHHQPKRRRASREDTSPPIDVGRRQRTESLRRHIRSLME